MIEYAPQISIILTKSEVAIMLHFQLCSARFTQCYKQRTVGKVLLQSIQSPWKIWMIHIGKPLYYIGTFGCQQKEIGHKGEQRQVHDACIKQCQTVKKSSL